MAKQSGLGDNLYIGGYDLSGDTGELSAIKQPRGILDVTGINKSARERIHGMRDGEIGFKTFFNDQTTAGLEGQHVALSTLPTADVICSYLRGTTLGNWSACMTAKQVNYDGARGTDGSFTFDTQMLADGYALEWGKTLTAGKRQDTTATAPGTGVDFASAVNATSSAFGLAAYLHVFSFTGTSATMTIQDATTSGGAYSNITGLSAFTAATARTSQRIETDTLTRTIRQFLKVNTTGTFSECTFAVIVVRYDTANRGS